MTGDGNKTCQRNCWLIAGCGGILLALLLVYLAKYPFGTAAFLGVLLFAIGGAFLSWAFCGGQSASTQPPQPVEVRRAPEPPSAPPAVSPAPAAPSEPPAPPAAAAAAEPVVVMAAPAPAPAASQPARPAPKPRADRKPAAPKADKPAAPGAKPAAKPARAKAEKAPRAAGLDAAITKTKDDSAPSAASPFLAAPRSSGPDDLKEIVGVGPALERLLNSIGVWHFDQIAAWKARDIALVDSKMEGFKGRITRDEWVKQARVLAKGKKA